MAQTAAIPERCLHCPWGTCACGSQRTILGPAIWVKAIVLNKGIRTQQQQLNISELSPMCMAPAIEASGHLVPFIFHELGGRYYFSLFLIITEKNISNAVDEESKVLNRTGARTWTPDSLTSKPVSSCHKLHVLIRLKLSEGLLPPLKWRFSVEFRSFGG